MNSQRLDTRRHHARFSALWYATPVGIVALALGTLHLVDVIQDADEAATATSQPVLSPEFPIVPHALPIPANVARVEPPPEAASTVVAAREAQPEADVVYEEESHAPTF